MDVTTLDIDPGTGLQVLEKTVYEEVLFNMDFNSKMNPTGTEGRTIASVDGVSPTIVGNVTGSSNITVGTPTFSGTEAQFKLSAGTNLEDYYIAVKVIDDAGNKREGVGLLKVRNYI